MNYSYTKTATFLARPNRFIAHVLVDGREEIVHVKNTGRCHEILKEGVQVDEIIIGTPVDIHID